MPKRISPGRSGGEWPHFRARRRESACRCRRAGIQWSRTDRWESEHQGYTIVSIPAEMLAELIPGVFQHPTRWVGDMKPPLAVDFPQHGEMVPIPMQYDRQRSFDDRVDRQLNPVSLHPYCLGAFLQRPHRDTASRQVDPVAKVFGRDASPEISGDHPQAGHSAVRLLDLVVVGESTQSIRHSPLC